MNNSEYLKMLYVFNDAFDEDSRLVIEWSNGLKVIGKSFTGIYETDTEPEDDDYCGEYAAAINEIEILSQGKNEYVEIFQNAIEISLNSIPERISLEDGTVVWERK